MSKPKRRILCVDDHEDLCDLVALLLPDCEVTCVHNKADALHQTASSHFDLILLDYHLPDGTGFDICMFIRGFDKKTPIVFFTGTKQLSKSQVAKMGAQGLIIKGPNLNDDLVKAVSAALAQ